MIKAVALAKQSVNGGRARNNNRIDINYGKCVLQNENQ